MTLSISDLHQSASLNKSGKLKTKKPRANPHPRRSILEIMSLPLNQYNCSTKECSLLLPLDGSTSRILHNLVRYSHRSNASRAICRNQSIDTADLVMGSHISLILSPTAHGRFSIYKHAHCPVLFRSYKASQQESIPAKLPIYYSTINYPKSPL